MIKQYGGEEARKVQFVTGKDDNEAVKIAVMMKKEA
jgi:hypothetical protein